MKKIEAIIKPFKLDDAKEGLAAAGIQGLTVSEVKGFGRQKGHTERYRGGRMDVGFVPKILLKVAVKSDDVDKAVGAICSAANTGNVGDGKVFVYGLQSVTRVRTGEKDNDAL